MKFRAFVLITILPQILRAADVCPLVVQRHLELDAIQQKFSGEWFSVAEKDMTRAPCFNSVPPDESQMTDFLKSHSIGFQRSKKINGIQFVGEDPYLLQLFSQIHTPAPYRKIPTPNFKSNCTQVLCAMQEIYGKKQGLQLLYMKAKFGYNGSDKVVRDSSPWKDSELDDVLTMFSNYPSSFFPIDEGRQFVHFKRGRSRGEDNTIADAMVEVFDTWNEQPKALRQATLFHELGHNLSDEGNKDMSSEWLSLSKWTAKTTLVKGDPQVSWSMGDKSAAVSRYGEKNPGEDFAETVVAYRFNAQRLKAQQPQKYEYMKNRVFDGIEYDSASSCSKGTKKQARRNETLGVARTLASLPAPHESELINNSKLMGEVEKACQTAMVRSLSDASADLLPCVHQYFNKQLLTDLANKRGQKNFDAGLVSAMELPRIPLPEGTEKAIAAKMRSDYSQKLTKALVGGLGYVFYGIGAGEAKKQAACAQAALNSYQVFESLPDSVDALKQDQFVFYHQSDDLALWTKKICNQSPSGFSDKNTPSSPSAVELTSIIEKSIP